MIKLIYLTFGGIDYNIQCVASIHSLFCSSDYKLDGFEVIVYTDNPQFIKKWTKKLIIKTIFLSPGEIKDLIGPTGFIFMAKMNIIKRVLDDFQKGCIYIDSDILFKKNPLKKFSTISRSTYLMQAKEQIFIKLINGIENNLHNKLGKYLVNLDYTLDNINYNVDVNSQFSYNAGIIGIHADKMNLLDDAIKLAEKIYSTVPIFIAEQTAFSIVFQQTGIIDTAEEQTLHYWGDYKKFTYTYLCRSMLRSHLFIKNYKKLGKAFNKLANENITEIKPWHYAESSLFKKAALKFLNIVDKYLLET